MKKNFIAILFCWFSISALAQTIDTATYSVAMRDGIHLATGVKSPSLSKKYPVIFIRTPYGFEYQLKVRSHFVDGGYVVVAQDCRGTGRSEGTFEPWLHEKQDGFDAIDWISKQPWCDGNIGMIGASYEGQVQWLASVGAHPALKCIIPQVSGTDAFLDVPYDHGIMKMSLVEWAFRSTYPEKKMPDMELDSLYKLPLSKFDKALYGVDVPIWDKWLEMEQSKHWKSASFLSELHKVKIPVLYVSGSWDVEALSTQTNWLTMASLKRKNQFLLFGPWEHQSFVTPVSSKVGDIDYGSNAKIDFEALWLKWFDRWLKGIENGIEKEARVKMFVTGANQWKESSSYPDADYESEKLFLTHIQGQHKLTASKFPTSMISTYFNNPGKARLNLDPEFSETSLYKTDSSGSELIFRSEVFNQAYTLSGPTKLHLEFSTDTPDVDFFSFLAEEDANGTLRALTHPGKLRARYWRSWDWSEALVKDKKYSVDIDLFPMIHQMKNASKLVLVVRSDWFPRYVRNLNTGESQVNATQLKISHITIYPESNLSFYSPR